MIASPKDNPMQNFMIQALHERNETTTMVCKQFLFILWRTRSCCSWMSKEMWSTHNTCHFYCKAIIWWIKKKIHVFNFNRDDESGPWCVMWWKLCQFIFGPNTIVLVTNIVECNKFVVMETQTFFDFGTFACTITKCILLHQMISVDFEWIH